MEVYKERLYIYGGYCWRVDNEQQARDQFNVKLDENSGELFELVPSKKELKRIQIKG